MKSDRRPKRILVADDYPDAAESLAALLVHASPAPLEVAIARDGARAVEVALASHPDIAILDIEMPELDGVEAALAIRVALGAEAPLLVALTGNAVRATHERTLVVFDRVLPKPANVDKLLVLIAQLG